MDSLVQKRAAKNHTSTLPTVGYEQWKDGPLRNVPLIDKVFRLGWNCNELVRRADVEALIEKLIGGAQMPPSNEVADWAMMKGCTIHHLACGGIAFYYDVVPKAGLVMSADRARYPGGARPIPGTQLVCGSCLRPIRDRKDLLVDETIVELPALQPKPVD